MGRPSAVTQKVQDEICFRMSEGESLAQICEDEHMPATSSVRRFLLNDANEAFRANYALARDMQADYFVDQIQKIASTPHIGEKHETTEVPGKVLDDGSVGEPRIAVKIITHDMIEHRRLQVDTLKWIAGKMKPKKYGDRLQVAGDPDSPLALHTMSEEKFMELAKKAKDTI